jgi:glutamate N-acetyltransferase / amino-acid N-acetyltransferase
MMKLISSGHTTSANGFVAAATACGLKQSGKPDLALLVSQADCAAAAVFTRNQVVAAPVVVDREILTADRNHIRAVVANAGCANACTGATGLANARRMQQLTAAAVGCRAPQVLVLSTGVIGVQLEMDKIAHGIRQAAGALSPQGGSAAVRAIMTTDTRPKQMAVQLDLPGGRVTLGGMAKGSGMIHPNMATMLAVITTDAAVTPALLQELLARAVNRSFNRISVDGDTSTNDTVLLLANGATGINISEEPLLTAFEGALTTLCTHLAQEIVRDGEGASKFVELTVSGAASKADALAVARTIATSPLVKTAFAGSDPNWGRILAAAGRAGVPLEPDRLCLAVEAAGKVVQLVSQGTPTGYLEAEAAALFAEAAFCLRLELGVGTAEVVVWTCDLSHDYVSINADYRT